MSHQQPKRAFGRWSLEETAALIGAWAPLYSRRRQGARDAWVPLHIRGRARSSCALAPEDWRAVACAVNSARAAAGLDSSRTHVQCKKRVEHLRRQYAKGQAAHLLGRELYHAVHLAWGDEAENRGAPASRDPAGDAARHCGAEADDDGVAAGGDAARRGAPVAEGFAAAAPGGRAGAAAGNARGGGSVVDADFATAWEEVVAAAGHEGSAARAAGGAPAVKEELVRQARARRGVEARYANAIAAAVAEHLGGALSAAFAARGETDAAVMVALGDMYKHLTMKRLELKAKEGGAVPPTMGAGNGGRP